MFDGKFVVGNINRNQPRKQPLRTMKAFAKFAKNKNDVLLHMQMDWNDIFGWPIEYFARLFGIGNKMVIPGHVGMPREEIVKVYQQWSINANSTAGEGFGLSTIEGAASGLPNILTDYTTSKELVLGGEPSPRGILVPYVDLYWEKIDVAAVQRALIDENKMAQAFQFYYDNPEIRIQHGKNAREWVEKNCNLKVIESQWLNVVKETLSN
jgi:glycosyltransferase involved in cell wall biosynthesis